jgi:hypothetical protein
MRLLQGVGAQVLLRSRQFHALYGTLSTGINEYSLPAGIY